MIEVVVQEYDDVAKVLAPPSGGVAVSYAR
jgi:hypothetical protein